MKVMLDLNVLVDVLQRREPFFTASAKVCDLVHSRRISGVVPSHAVTTVFYLVERHADRSIAENALEWMLALFGVASEDKGTFRTAKSLKFRDFEDAAVAAAAQDAGCDFIVSRNIADFAASPVKTVTPEELIEMVTVQV